MPSVRLQGIHNGRDGAPYHPSPTLLAAANTALLLNTPLLLAGEPGCGKTDFAWYAARALATALGDPQAATATPLECYVRSDLRARDLLYQYDALARFADAQHPRPDAPQRAQDARHYIALQSLGIGLMSPVQRVVLIDEIDKAPRDLPNDVLAALEDLRFDVPEINKTYPPDGQKLPAEHRPIIILTSNSEKGLPDAFLRRVVYYNIPFPAPEELLAILQLKTQNLSKEELEAIIRHFNLLRDESVVRLHKAPATAELIFWADLLQRTGFPILKLDEYEDLDPKEKQTLITTYAVIAKTKEDHNALKKLMMNDGL